MNTNPEKNGRRQALQLILAASTAPAIIGTARAADQVNWKVQLFFPKASSSYESFAVPFGEELRRRTDGRLNLDFYGAGEIAKGSEIFNMVQRGVIPMALTFPGYNVQESELMAIAAGVPWTFRETWQAAMFTKNQNYNLEKELNDTLASRGVIAKAARSYPSELTLKRNLKSRKDAEKIKIRVIGPLTDLLGAVGFSPQQIDGSEAYQALSTGVIDGASWGARSGPLSLKLWEIAKYQVTPPVMYNTDYFFINQRAYDKLPEDLRDTLMGWMNEAYYYGNAIYEYQEARATKTGFKQYDMKLIQYPEDIIEGFNEASAQLLDKEAAKGDKASAVVARMRKFLDEVIVS